MNQPTPLFTALPILLVRGPGRNVSRFILLSLTALALGSTLLPNGNCLGDEPKTRPAVDEKLPWTSRLYTPTLLTKLNETWFLVVCWHHRILFNDKLDPDLGSWQILDDTLSGSHSIASNGTLYVVDNTGSHGLRVYSRKGNVFTLVQEIGDLGKRTHRVIYDPVAKAFFVLSSNSQDLYKFAVEGEKLKLVEHRPLAFLEGQYTRSLTLHDDHLYFTSGPGAILKVRHRDGSYTVVERHTVPEKMKSMNDVFPASDGWWYLTATPQAFIRTRDLASLARGEYEDLQEKLGFAGTPYYLFEENGRLWIPQITQHSGVVSFKLLDNQLIEREVLFDFGPPAEEDLERMKVFPR